MICTETTRLSNYKGMAKNLDTLISYYEEHGLLELLAGRNDIDAENVYINRFRYATIPEGDAFYEAHERYADVHFLLSGEELVKVADANSLVEFERNESADYIGYRGEAEAVFSMTPAKVLIVYPGEAHMVKVQRCGEAWVEKAVAKVRI